MDQGHAISASLEPPIEPEGEFFEIGLQVLRADAVMRAVQPSLQGTPRARNRREQPARRYARRDRGRGNREAARRLSDAWAIGRSESAWFALAA